MEEFFFFLMKWLVQANPAWDLDFTFSGMINDC